MTKRRSSEIVEDENQKFLVGKGEIGKISQDVGKLFGNRRKI